MVTGTKTVTLSSFFFIITMVKCGKQYAHIRVDSERNMLYRARAALINDDWIFQLLTYTY